MTKKVVLVVDNDEDAQEAMADALSHAGFYSLGARSARQALSFLEDIVPSVVILDFLLADMDGVKLAQAIRGLPAGVLMPMLVVTGSAAIAREHLLKENLNIQVLAKPVNPVVLTKTVEYLSVWHPSPLATKSWLRPIPF
jgi:DNA-binding response OmpR family regulator